MTKMYSEKFKEVTNLITPINQIIKGDDFINSCLEKIWEDGVKFNVGNEVKVSIPYSGSGIYVIWADLSNWGESEKPWNILLSDFLDCWDKPEEISYFPKSNRTRVKLADYHEKNVWIPFYIGKSENVANRIEQHLYLDPKKSTYALKLNHRIGLLKGVTFDITWIPLETTKETYFLVAQVESILREKIAPIIGKQ
ncbi:MAG: hypothetical protein RLZ75_672 [Pseudomonadota bacterium]|jgi:hypothetical protein